LKDTFDADKCPHFLVVMRNDYTSFSDKAVNVLLLSVTTNAGETAFSAVSVKSKNKADSVIN